MPRLHYPLIRPPQRFGVRFIVIVLAAAATFTAVGLTLSLSGGSDGRASSDPASSERCVEELSPLSLVVGARAGATASASTSGPNCGVAAEATRLTDGQAPCTLTLTHEATSKGGIATNELPEGDCDDVEVRVDQYPNSRPQDWPDLPDDNIPPEDTLPSGELIPAQPSG